MKTLQIDAFKHNILQALKAVRFAEFSTTSGGVASRLKSRSDDDSNQDNSEEKFASTHGLTSEEDGDDGSLTKFKLDKGEVF